MSSSDSYKSVLVTGANGFLGSHTCEILIEKGFVVYAATRKNSNLKYIENLNVNIVYLDYNSTYNLSKQISYINPDFILHIAGLTSSTNKQDFYKINFSYTKNLIDAVGNSDINRLKKFIFISSLAAQGPGNSKNLEALTTKQIAKPICSYGRSKLLAENYLKKNIKIPYIILRPAAIYGPRDLDCSQCFAMIEKNIEVYIGIKESLASFIYVKDIIKIIYLLLKNNNLINKTYIVSDNKLYTHSDFLNTIKELLNKKTIKIKLPLIFVWLAFNINNVIGKIFNKRILLNREKYFILKEQNWYAVDFDLMKDINFYNFYSLKKGLFETAQWLNTLKNYTN